MGALFKARWAILLTTFGLVGAYVFNSKLKTFEALPIAAQLLVLGSFAMIGLMIIWKDQSSESAENK